MGLASDLGYTFAPPNAAQRTVQRMAATRGGAWVLSKTMHHADRALFQLTRGRSSLPSLTSGLPVIMVTTTGAKTGLSRQAPLIGIPTGEHLAIVGSGFGQAPTPGWVHNLRANPAATVAYRDHTVSVVAREIDGPDAEEVWATARDLYPGYAVYPQRASHRSVAVFVLEPAG